MINYKLPIWAVKLLRQDTNGKNKKQISENQGI